MFFKPDRIYVPEKGAGSLLRALGTECAELIRTSSPVHRVDIEDGKVRGVLTDEQFVEADYVICTTPASKVGRIIPELSSDIRNTLD